jgi:hypothetical protein
VTADQLQRAIELLPEEAALADLERWLALRDRESKTIIRLATSMRLTHQSRLRADNAATQHNNVGGADKPWA